MSDNRPAVYLEGNNVIYRASALGHCLRMLWAARSGLDARPFPDKIQDAMDEGTRLEPTILKMLEDEHGWQFDGKAQHEADLIIGSWNGLTFIVRGKPDEERDGLPVDVKAFTQTLVDEWYVYGIERYIWQQASYALARNTIHYYMPIYNKDKGEIELPTLKPYTALVRRDDIFDRIMQVEEAFESGTMPDDCPAEYGCPYFYLHDAKTVASLPDDAVAMASARIRLNEKINAFTNARKVLDKAIAKHVSEGITYYYDGYTVVAFANPRRFNTKAVQRRLTELEVDWENDDELWTPGKGTQVRMTKR